VHDTRTILFLSPLFLNIASEWRGIFSRMNGKNYPSLTLDVLKTVYANNSVEIYRSYNNIEYNPFSVGYNTFNNASTGTAGLDQWFNGSGIDPSNFSAINMVNLSFSLNVSFPNTPFQIINNVTSNGSSTNANVPDISPQLYSPDCSGTGSYTSTYWTYNYYTYTRNTGINNTTGYLPLIAVHLGRNTANGLSQIAMYASLFIESDTIGFTSAQPYVPTSGQVSTSMSTTPSFSHVAWASYILSGNTAVANPLNLSAPSVKTI
jgi:hypothetical protein